MKNHRGLTLPNDSERARHTRSIKRGISEGAKDGPIKVRLDSRTLITLSSLDKVEFWRSRYPNLQVL